MKPKNSNKYWMCPFFMWDGYIGVSCEGESKVILPDEVTANDYQNKYCASENWQNCSLARALKERIERDEEEKTTK